MKKAFVILVLTFLSTLSTYAQFQAVPDDSVSNYLSKTWIEKARFLGGMQVEAFGPPVTYTFKADSSFTKTIDKQEQGTWSYDRVKRVVVLKIKGSTDFYLVQLTKKELLLSSDLEEGAKKGLGILVLFKPEE